jgi:DNA helicase-2/ATP-dependent DNA helicase PcrA
VLPFPLRGDASGLPRLSLAGATDQKGVEQARKAFEAAWKEHDEREERRLTYVAVTRARRMLLCSGYWWGAGVRKPRGASRFLQEVADRCRAGAGVVDGWAAEPPADAPNPTDALVATAPWPVDPLGERRPGLEQAAALVRAAAADLRAATTTDPGAVQPALPGLGMADPPADEESRRWAEEVTLLLAERDRRAARSGTVEVVLPEHLSVSQLVTLRQDPQALASSLRRPMPTRPDPYARRGTAFHAWLEQHFGGDRLLDLDELPGAADPDAAPDQALGRLREAFLASEWADRVPVDVEVPFATRLGAGTAADAGRDRGGVVVRGRMDAVFRNDDGSFEVVDWKTGRRPTGAAAEAAAVQLAAYRLAWAELAGVPVARVRAGFHYVAEGVTVRPTDLLDADQLTALVTGVPEAVEERAGAP